MSFEPHEYLRHILVESEYLIAHCAGLEFEEFVDDATLTRAFVRSLEIIGEAVKNIPADFREQHVTIEWRSMSGMRDRLIHGYFGIDYEIVWEVVTEHIPMLHAQIRAILSD